MSPTTPAITWATACTASISSSIPNTGFIKLLDYWAITDCGRVINPLIVDDQVRGAIVQGIGSVLYEECMYDEHGCLLNGTMADYLAPMAGEMPDIYVEQIETPERTTELGAKGVGELGLTGAMGALWVADQRRAAPARRDASRISRSRRSACSKPSRRDAPDDARASNLR